VVRGADLLDSTPRQIYLQHLLGLATPCYSHLPLVVDKHGNKLSKQTYAPPLDPNHPVSAIVTALQFLGQSPPAELSQEHLDTVWDWAISHWNPQRF
jgi:glutamyl-Q tRNA(Asp) synthetase